MKIERKQKTEIFAYLHYSYNLSKERISNKKYLKTYGIYEIETHNFKNKN